MKNKPEYFELELIKKIKRGDKMAFGKLLHQYNARVYGYFFRTFGKREIAQDLFQETFLRVWQSFQKFDENRSFAAWVFTIAERVRIDAIRSQSVRTGVIMYSVPLDFVGEDNPETQLEANELKQQIEEVVRSLPEKQRKVFLLRQQGELPFKEIANIMHEPLNSVLSHMHYAVKKLRLVLKESHDA